jgi:hypothetical protein
MVDRRQRAAEMQRRTESDRRKQERAERAAAKRARKLGHHVDQPWATQEDGL